ncbi:hypothetical protein RchiOBHm_Chr1g0367671 [Rosa chinensis]|uniref:Uncharacterized protein n=1 Tax=Rosa chinensis TaxID=74649 RepID=A0A2P6SKL7_ROSCH|nr:hypothetical protein RchiOBHm_Chr1g0367671 [Rosa chinensis]
MEVSVMHHFMNIVFEHKVLRIAISKCIVIYATHLEFDFNLNRVRIFVIQFEDSCNQSHLSILH